MFKILVRPKMCSVKGNTDMTAAIARVKKQYHLTGENLSRAANQHTYIDPFGRKINIICSEEEDSFLMRKVTSLGDGLNRIKRLFRVKGENIMDTVDAEGHPINGSRTYIGKYGERVKIYLEGLNNKLFLFIKRVPNSNTSGKHPVLTGKLAALSREYSKYAFSLIKTTREYLFKANGAFSNPRRTRVAYVPNKAYTKTMTTGLYKGKYPIDHE